MLDSNYLIQKTELKIVSPSSYNKISLRVIEKNKVYTLAIDDQTLNDTIVCLFTLAFSEKPKGIIVWDWESDLKSIEKLIKGEVLKLEQNLT